MLYFIFSVSFILCDGIPEWWRPNVPHTANWAVPRTESQVLCCRNNIWAQVPA